MTDEELLSHLRTVPDFPVPGILFFDITTLFQDAACLREMLDRLYEMYRGKGITKVVGLESRGFLLGTALAARLGAGFVMARKMGKLPGEKMIETYDKEYGHDTIEIHIGSIQEGDVVLLHDDLLATGGTIAAANRLISKFKPSKVYMNFLINIGDCPRLPVFPKDIEMTALLNVVEKA